MSPEERPRGRPVDPLGVHCPACGSDPGRPCLSDEGAALGVCHTWRYDLAGDPAPAKAVQAAKRRAPKGAP